MGYIIFDGDRNLENNGVAGIGIEYKFAEHFGMELSAFGGSTDRDFTTPYKKTDISTGRLDALIYLPGTMNIEPYVAIGYNYLHLEYQEPSTSGPDYEEDQLNAGVGMRYAFNDVVSLRTDLRFFTGKPKNSNAEFTENVDTMLTIGLSFAVGGTNFRRANLLQEKDSDSDGILDRIDACPDTEENQVVDNEGCPVDVDGDGVLDAEDKCAGTPPIAEVDEFGCPLDSDNDGVEDYLDDCPDTPLHTHVDDAGCPLDKELVSKITLSIQFPENSTQFIPNSAGELSKLAKYMKKYESVVVEVQGHTDSANKHKYNMILSQGRADAVAQELVTKYKIKSRRIIAVGYGEAQPIASNFSKKGREKNERIVVVIERPTGSCDDCDEKKKPISKLLKKTVRQSLFY